MKENKDRLKSLKNKLHLTQALSFMCTVLPLLIYVIIGLANGEVHKGDKVFLGFSIVVALILTTVNILMKYHLRSPIFVLLLGVYKALNNVIALLVIMSIGIILDEFVLQPVIKSLKAKVVVRKELEHGE